MKFTPDQLMEAIRELCADIFAPVTDHPEVQYQLIGNRPIKVRIAVEIKDLSPEAALACVNRASVTAAWLKKWPYTQDGMHLHSDPRSYVLSADGKYVLLDLVMLSAEIVMPEMFTPATS